MKSVTTYLNFNGSCRQAMTFYQQCLDADIQLSPFPDEQGKPSTDPNAGIMHARLSRSGTPILMASDTPPDESLKADNNRSFSVSVDCESLDELERYFKSLSQSGQVRLPLSDMILGGTLRHAHGSVWRAMDVQLRPAPETMKANSHQPHRPSWHSS
jgi:PhnB protein